MKRFKLKWRDGSVNEVEGADIADAMNRAGFGLGTLVALDYHEEIKKMESTKEAHRASVVKRAEKFRDNLRASTIVEVEAMQIIRDLLALVEGK